MQSGSPCEGAHPSDSPLNTRLTERKQNTHWSFMNDRQREDGRASSAMSPRSPRILYHLFFVAVGPNVWRAVARTANWPCASKGW